jgi:hypothetical protein
MKFWIVFVTQKILKIRILIFFSRLQQLKRRWKLWGGRMMKPPRRTLRAHNITKRHLSIQNSTQPGSAYKETESLEECSLNMIWVFCHGELFKFMSSIFFSGQQCNRCWNSRGWKMMKKLCSTLCECHVTYRNPSTKTPNQSCSNATEMESVDGF